MNIWNVLLIFGILALSILCIYKIIQIIIAIIVLHQVKKEDKHLP